MEDITNTGAKSFRDLLLENNKEFLKAVKERTAELNDQYRSFAGSREFDPYENTEQGVRSSLYGTSTPWGQSMFDEDVANANEFEQLQDIRAKNQPWYAKLGAGLVKGVGLAGTTFIDGTAGLIYGATQMPDKGISALWDNEISNGLQEFNRAMEDVLPNYRTMEEQEGPWYGNLGTINFWADSFLKNLGFTVGALYSGMAWTKGLLLIGKGALALGKLGSIMKPVESLGVAMQQNGLGAKLTGSLFSAVNEGRIEANNTVHDVRELRMLEMQDAYMRKKNEIAALPVELQGVAMNDLNDNYNTAVNLLDEDLKKIGLTDLLINIPILALDNFWTFGKMYSQGFKNAKNVNASNVKKGITDRVSVSQAANEAADAAEDAIRLGIEKEGSNYTWKTITGKKALGKGALTGLREGNEELSQAWASEFAGNWYGYKDSPDTYYRAMTDPKALLETQDAWAAASQAFANTYGNIDRWEEFAIGALTGLLGTPTFGSRLNASANTYVGRNKMIGLSGGVLGEWKVAQEMNRLGNLHVDAMNKLVNKVEHNKGILAASKKFTDAMDGWAKDDDKFEFKNSEDNEDWNGISSFMSTGRKNDLLALVDQDFENASDEELAAIAAFTTPEGSVVKSGGWRDSNGDIINVDSAKEDKEAMRQQLIDKREDIKKKIEDYEKSLSYIRNIVAGSNNVSEDEVLELAWLHWKTGRFNQRFDDVVNKNANIFHLIDSGLEERERVLEGIVNTQPHSTEGLSRGDRAIAEAANKLLEEDKKEAEKLLKNIKAVRNFFRNVLSSKGAGRIGAGLVIGLQKKLLDGLANDFDFYSRHIAGDNIPLVEYGEALNDLSDLGKLAQAYIDFNKRLSDFTKDPQKIKQNRKKIDKQNAERQLNIDRSSRRTNARNIASDRQALKDTEDDSILDILNSLDPNNPNDEELIKATLDELDRRNIHRGVNRGLQRILDNMDLEEEESEEQSKLALAVQLALTMEENAFDRSDTSSEYGDIENEVWSIPEDIDVDDDLKLAAFDLISQALSKYDIDSSEADNMVADNKNVARDEDTGEVKTPAENASSASKPTGHDPVDSTPAVNSNPKPATQPSQSLASGNSSSALGSGTLPASKSQTMELIKEDVTTIAVAVASFLNIVNLCNADDVLRNSVFDFAGTVYSHCQDSDDLKSIADTILDEDDYRILEDLAKDYGVTKVKEVIPIAIRVAMNLKNSDSESLNDEEDYSKEVGPSTQTPDINIDEDAYDNLETLQTVIGTWFPLIRQYQGKGRSTIPYYQTPLFKNRLREKLKRKGFSGKALQDVIDAEFKRVDAIYKYLSDNNAFYYGAKVKKGDEIYFVIDPNLNDKAGEIVILMLDKKGHIVGALKGKNEETNTGQLGLSEFIEKTEAEYQLAVVDNKVSDKWVSSKTSKVRLSLIGKVMYSNDSHSLNEIFATGTNDNPGVAPFLLGVCLAKNTIVLTSRSSGTKATDMELGIIQPYKGAVAGQPFLMLPTGNGESLVTVPVHMNLYSSLMKGSMFDLWVIERLTLLFSSRGFNVNTAKSQKELKDTLSDFFAIYGGTKGGFHIDILGGKFKISVTMKDGKQTPIYEVNPNEANVEGIMNALRNAGLGIQVNRKYINGKVTLGGKKVDYNQVLGELIYTNLPIGTTSTVNDWFTVDPINDKGKPMRAKNMKDGPSVDKNPKSGDKKTTVRVKGTVYIYKSNGDITDAAGTKLNITDTVLLNKIKAAAEIVSKNLPPVDIYNTSVYNTKYGLYDTRKSEFVSRDTLKKAPPKVVQINGVSYKVGDEVPIPDGQEGHRFVINEFYYKDNTIYVKVIEKYGKDSEKVDKIKDISIALLAHILYVKKDPALLDKPRIDKDTLLSEDNLPVGKIMAPTEDGSSKPMNKVLEDFLLESLRTAFSDPNSTNKSIQDAVTSENFSAVVLGTVLNRLFELGQAVKEGVITADEALDYVSKYLIQRKEATSTSGVGAVSVLRVTPKSFDINERVSASEAPSITEPIDRTDYDKIRLRDLAVKPSGVEGEDYVPVAFRDLIPGVDLLYWYTTSLWDESAKKNRYYVWTLSSDNSNYLWVEIDNSALVDVYNNTMVPTSKSKDFIQVKDSAEEPVGINDAEEDSDTFDNMGDSSEEAISTGTSWGFKPKTAESPKTEPANEKSERPSSKKSSGLKLEEGEIPSFVGTKNKEMWQALTLEQLDKINEKKTLMAKKLAVDRLSKLWLKGKFKEGTNIDNLINPPKHRISSGERLSREEQIEKELEWARRALPQLSEEDRVRLVEGMIRIADSELPRYAWGKFLDGVITISRTAARGTVYHEAFHFVTGTLLSNEELEDLYTEAEAKYKMTNLDDIEEELAEDFRKYMQTEETPFLGKIVKIFRTIKHGILTILGNESVINNMFYRISRGKLIDRAAKESRNSRYRDILYTEEEKNIIRNAPRDAQGRLLAPNGKPSNLTDRQYAQVRTKAFKEWFGDWENNPSEASKVVDENGEPLVVYHGTVEAGFTVFNTHMNPHINGSYFSNDQYVSSTYAFGEELYATFLNIRNPKIVDFLGGTWAINNLGTTTDNLVNNLEALYDGIIMTNIYDSAYANSDKEQNMGLGNDYVILNPNLVKSATDNVGTFSTLDNDIRFRTTLASQAQDIFFNEVYGKRLTDYDIVRINRKLGRLSQLAGDSWTWHLQESRNGGYYVAGYNNRPVIPGQYTSPSFRYAPLYREIPLDTLRLETQTFLDNFGITINDVSDYNSDIPLFDALNRVINVRNAEDITEGVGYAVAFMMLHTPLMRDILSQYMFENSSTGLKSLRRAIRKGREFETKNVSSRDMWKGFAPEMKNKVLKEVGQAIATELRDMYNLSVEEQEPKSFLGKIWSVITEFFNMLTPRMRIKFDVILNYPSSIANAIKLNDPSIILLDMMKPGTLSEAIRVSIELALEENPYEDGIIRQLQKYNIALAGSASIALEGTLYRPIENPLHDIDFNAVGHTRESLDKIVKGLSPYNTHIRTILDGDGKSTETYLILDRPYEIKEKQMGEGIKPIQEIYDKLGNLIGSYIGSELTLANGVQGKFLDFFIGKNNRKFDNVIIKVGNTSYLIANYRNAFEAKIEWARPKDIWDYNRFVPSSRQELLERNKAEKRKELREKVSKARVIWGHPAIGKTTYLELNLDILEWDLEVNPRRNEFFRELIDPEHKMDVDSPEYKDLRSKYMAEWKQHPEYVEFLTREWNLLLERAKREGKRLFASPLPLLEIGKDDFDLVVAIDQRRFMERNQARGGTRFGSLGWKLNIDELLVRFDSGKVVYTDMYFTEFMQMANSHFGELNNETSLAITDRNPLSYSKLPLSRRQQLRNLGVSELAYEKMTEYEKREFWRCKM